MGTYSEQQEQADDLRWLADRARRLASMLVEPEKSRVLGCAKELEIEAAQLAVPGNSPPAAKSASCGTASNS